MHCLTFLLHALPHIFLSLLKTSALFLERGDVLSAYIFALQYYDKTRVRGDDEGGKSSEGTSSSILFRLLSLRPNICSATMNRYPGLQDLMVRAVYKAFKDVGQEPKESNRDEDIAMFIRKDGENIPSEVHLPLTLLQAAIVLISNWQDDTKSAAKQEFKELTKFLIRAGGRHGSSEGAASAIFASTKQKAVSSEEVSFYHLFFVPVLVNHQLVNWHAHSVSSSVGFFGHIKLQ
jgi:hypothetical protein